MQQTAEVDLDRLVDYRTEYCSVIKKHKITGDNLTGLCPFHDDRANSFSVDLRQENGIASQKMMAETSSHSTQSCTDWTPRKPISRYWKSMEH